LGRKKITCPPVEELYATVSKMLYYWYCKYLSNYNIDIAQGKWQANAIVAVDESTGEVRKEQPVYVYKPENIGEQMSIDDEALGHGGFTIMSNTQTGKIAMMIESTKCEDVEAALALFGKGLEKVKSISCDMSPTCLKACRDKLPQAQTVVDKFHVMLIEKHETEIINFFTSGHTNAKVERLKEKSNDLFPTIMV
jgi:hypothetical protein